MIFGKQKKKKKDANKCKFSTNPICSTQFPLLLENEIEFHDSRTVINYVTLFESEF